MEIKEKINLAAYTTLKTGGVAAFFAEAKTIADLTQAKNFADDKDLPIMFLGGGSNVLFSDAGFPGLVINNHLSNIEYFDHGEDEVLVKCGSGEVLDRIVQDTITKGFYGLENLSAIPGTVGAAPVQNVGAYGTEMSDLVFEVEAFDFNSGELKKFTNTDCNFGYRESFFKTPLGKKYFITSVTLRLKKNYSLNLNYPDLKNKFGDTKTTLQEVREAIIEIRSKKFPNWKVIGTAGSFFKNPIINIEAAEVLKEKFPELPQYEVTSDTVKIPLGYVLDKLCGLKGFREGNVGLYQEQALVLVNYGGATSSEIKNFAKEISEKVFQKTNLEIEPEVRFF